MNDSFALSTSFRYLKKAFHRVRLIPLVLFANKALKPQTDDVPCGAAHPAMSAHTAPFGQEPEAAPPEYVRYPGRSTVPERPQSDIQFHSPITTTQHAVPVLVTFGRLKPNDCHEIIFVDPAISLAGLHDLIRYNFAENTQIITGGNIPRTFWRPYTRIKRICVLWNRHKIETVIHEGNIAPVLRMMAVNGEMNVIRVELADRLALER
ncbi:MAG: hypothetical protein M1835_000038 [Candelina submexicana]|nr:MAG: hypothetical protein M1835_000038 [Candelina submexicana]